MLEAAHAGVPLVALTADRPARLRGTGANQTTDQVRLFGDAASFADLTAPAPDALDAAWLPGGPVHLNCQFDEPLIPEPGSPERSGSRHAGAATGRTLRTIRGRGPGRRTGRSRSGPARSSSQIATRGPSIRVLAEQARWPLLAEPTSGSRNGDWA